MNELALPRTIQSLVDEYNEKAEAIPSLLAAHVRSISNVQMGCSIGGHYGGRTVSSTDAPHESSMRHALLVSAWHSAYKACKMDIIGTAEDKKQYELAMAKPPPFTYENLVGTFGPYVSNPREHILRGVAEVFCKLDPAYKSHSKVKVGVKGLPKRVIIQNMSRYSGWAHNTLKDLLTALQVFDGDGIPDHQIITDITYERIKTWRGLTFKWFKNGNLHVHFNEHTCLQINRALAEYYGDVLPDVEPDKENMKTRESTSVSKDLQYYPTPTKTVVEFLKHSYLGGTKKILEPSCGCGRLMDYIKERTSNDSDVVGIEYDAGRANIARSKGHNVMVGNFLEQPPQPIFDMVIMNPPFYGKHYLKHLNHAMKFLKEGGTLMSILPATAHYDHKAIEFHYQWRDLPVGSFAESGVRVPTGYITAHKRS